MKNIILLNKYLEDKWIKLIKLNPSLHEYFTAKENRRTIYICLFILWICSLLIAISP